MVTAMCYIVCTMAIRVGIRELRQQASALLKRVASGEVIDVTDRGHLVARIVPLRMGELEQLVAEGAASDAHGRLLDVVDLLELPAKPIGSVLPSAALAELRRDEH
jgi:prevent-host-death family protein